MTTPSRTWHPSMKAICVRKTTLCDIIVSLFVPTLEKILKLWFSRHIWHNCSILTTFSFSGSKVIVWKLCLHNYSSPSNKFSNIVIRSPLITPNAYDKTPLGNHLVPALYYSSFVGWPHTLPSPSKVSSTRHSLPDKVMRCHQRYLHSSTQSWTPGSNNFL